MSHSSRLQELLSRWHGSQATQPGITAEELCADAPELLDEFKAEIARIKVMEQFLASSLTSGGTDGLGTPLAGQEAETLAPKAPAADDATLPPDRAAAFGPVLDGTRVPGYEILGTLGRGGMGVVYQARQLKLGRMVALKMILAGAHAGVADVGRFRTEAEAIARLQHPNIVQVFEVGEHGGLPFFSLEFCGGGSLEKELKGVPLPAKKAAALVEVLARAMQAAHDKGIVHRDLKPANVLLTEGGTPKITDFGLAKKLDEAGQTATGAVMGTPSYMAPEQASGKGATIGPACDVYALGAILYECLTGRPPFRGPSTMDTILQVVGDEPVPPTQLQSRVPRDLETICLKCLHKQPARRYATALALAEDLARFQQGDPIQGRRVGRFERVAKWARKHPAASLLYATIAAILLALFLGLPYVSFREQKLRRAALKNEERALESLAVATANEQRANHALADLKVEKRHATDLLYATRINLAHREWQAGIAHRARQLLDDCPRDQRGWEWDYLKGLFDGRSMLLSGHAAAVFDVALTPDGGRAVTLSKDGTVRVWDTRTGAGLKQLDLPAQLLAISPDGAHAAVAVQKSVRVFELENGRMVHTTDLANVPCGLRFVRDGADLAVALLDGEVRFLDAASGKERSHLARRLDLLPATQALLGLGQGIAISPDGRWLGQGGTEGKLRVWDAATGEHVLDETAHLHLVRQVAFSPDGRRLASPGLEGDIRIWDLERKQPVQRLIGHRSMVHCVAFTPDGKQLVSGSQDTTVRVWDLETSESVLTFTGHASEVYAIAVAGGRVASAGADATARVWDLNERVLYGGPVQEFLRGEKVPDAARRGSHEALTLYAYLGRASGLAFSPNGKTLAAVGRLTPSAHAKPAPAPEVTVWDLSDRRLVHQLNVPQEHTHHLAYSHDGRLLVVGTGGSMKDPAELNAFDTTTGQRVWHWEGPPGAELRPAFANKGDRLAATLNGGTADNLLFTWDAASGKELLRQRLGGPHTRATFSPDGKSLIAAGAANGMIVIEKYDAEAGQLQASWPAEATGLTSLVCGPEGLVAAATMGDRPIIRLFRLEDGRAVGALEGHVGSVTDLAFSPDGQRLLSAGSDFAVRLWHTGSGRELLTFREHTDVIVAVAWSPDGRRIGSAGHDNLIKVWEADASKSTPTTDDWPVLFHDNFAVEGDLGHWQPSEKLQWEAHGGALRGRQTTLKVNDIFFPFASAARSDVKLPRTAEVRLAYRAERPLAMGVHLAATPNGQDAYTVLLCGGAMPFGRPCAKLQRLTKGGNVTYVGLERGFAMQPGVWRQVRVLRQPQRITVFVDGMEVLSEPIPDVELPYLSLNGSWGSVGEQIEFKDVEVRVPSGAGR